jgi:ABC-type Zn uptake system ZnuABC Zn-binding protein ZnuA
MLACLAVLAGAASAEAKTHVVATTPDLAAIAAAIGGDRIDVYSICKPNEDPHFVQAKPSFIVKLNGADLLVENGLGLEVGWLPALIDQTRNAAIRVGGPGRVVAADGVAVLDMPTAPVTRAMGDVHPGGNPHFLLDPERGKQVADNVFRGLARIMPDDVDALRANRDALLQRIDAAEADCKRMLAPYRATKVVTYHKSLTYFCDRFGLDERGTIEPKPGIAPSGSYITSLIASMKAEGVKLILMEPWHERRTPSLVAEQVGAEVVEFPVQVGGAADLPDYPSVCRAIASRVAAALAGE